VTTSGTDQPVLIVRRVYVQQVGGGRSRWKSVGLTVNTTNSTLYEQFVEGLRPRTGYAVRVSVLYRSTLRSVWPSSIQHTFFTSRTMFCFCLCAFVCLQWRIQDFRTGGKDETPQAPRSSRRRREDRGAEGAEEVGCGEGVFPLPRKFFDFSSEK